MDNWLKQTTEPLYPDLLWSRPENKKARGKLLIVGGNSGGFAAPAAAYTAALQAGAGSVKVLLPQPLQKTLGKSFADAEFAPVTPSGSFSREALATALEMADWADGVLLAGDLGHNSETAILLDSLITKYNRQLSVAGDALDYFLQPKNSIMSRENTVLVIDIAKLQKLGKANRPGTAILHNMNLHELVTVLADWTNSTPVSFITEHAGSFVIASSGRVCTTPHKETSNWQTDLVASASVWQIQNPTKTFEALTTTIFAYIN
jgi:hypothetical protein